MDCTTHPLPADDLAFQGGRPLLRADGTQVQACSLDAYATLVKGLASGASPPLLYLHGRGEEPAKSVSRQRIVQALQAQTGQGVLMLNWNARGVGRDRDRPMANAIDAARMLCEVVKAQVALAHDQPDLPRPVLLVHSMGALVVQHSVERECWPAAGVFARVVFSQPDADAQGHADWLARLAQHESVWVTWNHHDGVLRAADDGRPAGVRPLGLGADPPLAAGVHYLNLSDAGPHGLPSLAHRVFLPSNLAAHPAAARFMQRLLRGDAVTPETDPALVPGRMAGVWHVHRAP